MYKSTCKLQKSQKQHEKSADIPHPVTAYYYYYYILSLITSEPTWSTLQNNAYSKTFLHVVVPAQTLMLNVEQKCEKWIIFLAHSGFMIKLNNGITHDPETFIYL